MTNWNKGQVLEFIEKYRGHDCLWKIKAKDYHNRDKREAAYKDLLEFMKTVEPQATKDTVVKKINNLRSAYRKEQRKIKSSQILGMGTDEVYTTKLWYFQELNFLHDQEESQPGGSNSEESNQLPVSTVPTLSTPSTSSCIVPPQKKRKLIPFTPTANDLLVQATRYLEMEDDECLTLAKAYATKLRKLTPKQLMFADKVINDTLLDAQMGLLTKGTHLVHPEPSSSPETSIWDSHFMDS